MYCYQWGPAYWIKPGVNFEEGGNRSARRKPSKSGWDRLKLNPHTSFVVEVEGVIEVFTTPAWLRVAGCLILGFSWQSVHGFFTSFQFNLPDRNTLASSVMRCFILIWFVVAFTVCDWMFHVFKGLFKFFDSCKFGRKFWSTKFMWFAKLQHCF